MKAYQIQKMFQTIITFALLFVVAYSVAEIIPILDGRIVGGQFTTIQEHPYQVSLRRSSRHACGGAIFKENAVITAAHCVHNRTAASLTVKAGSNHKILNGTIYQVQRVIPHPNYNSSITDNDIAILILSSKFKFSDSIKPIDLADTPPVAGSNVTVTGWGATKEGGSSINILKKVSINVITQESCKKSYAAHTITKGMICAGVESGGKDSCQGDSGGPLIQGGKLVGVVSWGIGCARKKYPGVYANVAVYKSWIEKNS